MKKKVTTILIIIIFLAGLSLLLYPLVANQWNNHRQKQLISGYEEVVAQKEKDGEINYEQEWKNADAYNDSLQPSVLPDSFAVAEASDEENSNYFACLNLGGDGMMGYIEVPKINIKIPIYHTTEDEVLQKAAGHLEGSSLPVGGKGTHAVISAHRGLPSATLFTDLDKLEEGDHFLLYILDDVLCYEVDKISVVEPKETDDLAVEPQTSGSRTQSRLQDSRYRRGVHTAWRSQSPYQLWVVGSYRTGSNRRLYPYTLLL